MILHELFPFPSYLSFPFCGIGKSVKYVWFFLFTEQRERHVSSNWRQWHQKQKCSKQHPDSESKKPFFHWSFCFRSDVGEKLQSVRESNGRLWSPGASPPPWDAAASKGGQVPLTYLFCQCWDHQLNLLSTSKNRCSFLLCIGKKKGMCGAALSIFVWIGSQPVLERSLQKKKQYNSSILKRVFYQSQNQHW